MENETSDQLDQLLSRIQDILNSGSCTSTTDLTDVAFVDCRRSTGRNFGRKFSHEVQKGIRNIHVNIHDSVPFWECQAPWNTLTLSAIFRMLEVENSDSIICVRRIHKLGFKSVRLLRRYFSAFGTVRKIVLLPSRPNEYGGKVDAHIRPSSMCFLVLDSRESALRVLTQEIYDIGCHQIHVSPYMPCSSVSSTEYDCYHARTSSVSSIETCTSR